MKHPIQITGGIHEGEIILPPGTDIYLAPIRRDIAMRYSGPPIGNIEQLDLPCRYDGSHLLAAQTEAPHRCPYCQTLILATAAVRCGSCGAPR